MNDERITWGEYLLWLGFVFVAIAAVIILREWLLYLALAALFLYWLLRKFVSWLVRDLDSIFKTREED